MAAMSENVNKASKIMSRPRPSGMSVFERGAHTLHVPMSLHEENRQRLVRRLKEKADLEPKSLIILEGGTDINLHSSDVEYIFRQESYFHWAFGVLEPGFFGAIDVDTGKSILFCPRLAKEYAIWMGHITTPDEFRVRYEVHDVFYVDEICSVLKNIEPSVLLTLSGVNSDSGLKTREAAFDGISQFKINNTVLHDHMAECRVFKTAKELEVLRYVCSVSAEAHKEGMRKIRVGMKEYQVESIFQHHSYYNGGCRHQGYTNICGCGGSSAVLHYGHAGAPNSETIKDGDMCLFDMGAEYYRYTSDVTCSYPANGKFTPKQKMIYEAVLAASNAVMAAGKPGVTWVDMHTVSYRAMLQKLIEGNLLKGDLEDMMKANMGAVFQPHGLGHLMGIDVHEVGGYLPHCPPRPQLFGFKNLRTARVLEENMVITIEPGCYFIDALLDAALANPDQEKFINKEMLSEFRGFGGVRIEDDVVITATGIENMSVVPRTVEEIEKLMAEGQKEEVIVPQLKLSSKS